MRWRAVEKRDPVAFNTIDGSGRVEHRMHVICSVHGQCAEERRVEPDRMEERHEPDGTVVVAMAQAALGGDIEDPRVGHAMRQHHALRKAGGSRRVEHERQRVGIRLRPWCKIGGVAASGGKIGNPRHRAVDAENPVVTDRLASGSGHGLVRHAYSQTRFADLHQRPRFVGLQARIDQAGYGPEPVQGKDHNGVFPDVREHDGRAFSRRESGSSKAGRHGLGLRDEFGKGRRARTAIVDHCRSVRRARRGQSNVIPNCLHCGTSRFLRANRVDDSIAGWHGVSLSRNHAEMAGQQAAAEAEMAAK